MSIDVLQAIEEAHEHYVMLIRNCDSDMISGFEAAGPLSKDSFIRVRQEAFRRLASLQHGVVFSDKPDGMMHHPV